MAKEDVASVHDQDDEVAIRAGSFDREPSIAEKIEVCVGSRFLTNDTAEKLFAEGILYGLMRIPGGSLAFPATGIVIGLAGHCSWACIARHP
jgi:hypothetical protein